jgi:DNA-binding CsgD family transcriptional regulator
VPHWVIASRGPSLWFRFPPCSASLQGANVSGSNEAMDPHLIDRIYECCFAPDLWPGVLGDLAGIATARAGFLFLSNGPIHHFASSTEIGFQALRPLVESGWVARSERFNRILAAQHAGFLTEAAVYTEEELKSDPFYRDILYPRGLGRATGTTVSLPTGDRFTISLEREYVRGPVEPAAIQELDALRPHLARSALMSARLQLQRARTASETLALIGLAALVLDDKGKVLAANPLIESMTRYVQWRAHDHLSLRDKSADRMLGAAIAAIDLRNNASVRSFPVRDADMQATMVAHVIPIRLSSRDIFVRCAAVLVLTPVTFPQAPPVELVQSLFDLTPAEARVARSLAVGITVDEIASNSGVSSNTIRAHVRAILQKTGCNRQVDVVALLTAISSAKPPDPH